jgi:glycine hydroxymethyltransferase
LSKEDFSVTKTNLDFLTETDPKVAEVLQQELQRQRDHLELIASAYQ